MLFSLRARTKAHAFPVPGHRVLVLEVAGP